MSVTTSHLVLRLIDGNVDHPVDRLVATFTCRRATCVRGCSGRVVGVVAPRAARAPLGLPAGEESYELGMAGETEQGGRSRPAEAAPARTWGRSLTYDR